MMRAALYNAAHGALILDTARRLTGCTTAIGLHGFAESQLTLAGSDLDEQLNIAARASMANLAVGEGWGAAYEGRLEDVPIGGSTLQLRAFGAARALDDIPYSALWSETRTEAWRKILQSEIATSRPDRILADTTNRLYLAAQKNATFGAGIQGLLAYQIPHGSSRDIIGAQFSYVHVAPAANWRAALQTRNADFSAIANAWIVTSAGAGTTAGSIHVTFAAAKVVNAFLDFNAAAAVYAGETDGCYLEITNLRLVTSTANRVNTTLTVARTNGVGVTCTVGSTARMYVGMQLVVNSGTPTNSEIVSVASILSSTTFTCTIVNAPGGGYIIGTTVQGFYISPDEIVKDCVSTVAALNTTQLAAATNRIQTGDIDCVMELYEDANMGDVLSNLSRYGDSAKNPWGWWVDRDRILVFERRGLSGYTFYIDVTPDQIQIIRSTADMVNSAYATYQEQSGRTLRTSTSADAPSIARYGLTRRAAVSAQTTSATQAGLIRDTFLQDARTPQPKIRITVDRLFDAGGNRVPFSAVNPGRGDTIVIRNLSPVLPGDADQLRRFRSGYCQIDWLAGTITLESEATPEGIDVPIQSFIQQERTRVRMRLPERSPTPPGSGNPRDTLEGGGRFD